MCCRTLGSVAGSWGGGLKVASFCACVCSFCSVMHSEFIDCMYSQELNKRGGGGGIIGDWNNQEEFEEIIK